MLQNPVAQVVVAILWGHGPFATPGQGRGDAHWVCTGLHPRDERRKPGEAPQDAPHDVLGRRDAVGGLTHCVKSRLRRELYHPQRSSETLRLACKIAPICLIPCVGRVDTSEAISNSRFDGLRIAVFASVVRRASLFRRDNHTPPFLSDRGVRQESDKCDGAQGYQLHGSADYRPWTGRSTSSWCDSRVKVRAPVTFDPGSIPTLRFPLLDHSVTRPQQRPNLAAGAKVPLRPPAFRPTAAPCFALPSLA